MTRRVGIVLAVAMLLISACSSSDRDSGSGDDTGSEGESSSEATSDAITEFGDLEFPCGPNDGGGTLPDDPDETFGVTDAGINVATFSDPGFASQPGLNQELFDASEAFVAACNDAGGINGRPVELHLRDAAVLQYPPQVETTCLEDFAAVGGGVVLDDTGAQQLTDCGVPNFAGYTVTAKASLADNVVTPVPNPPNQKPAAWLQQLIAELDEDGAGTGLTTADVIEHAGIVYGDLQTTADVAEQFRQMAQTLGFEFVYDAPFNIAGEANWAPFAAAIEDAGVEFLIVFGDPAPLEEAMNQLGSAPAVMMSESNLYDEVYAERLAGLNPESLHLVRTAYWPYQRADENPATATYLDIMETYLPDGKVAQLGMQAMSAWLLFAQSAAECDRNDDLSRTCVYETGKAVDAWTGGGLHAETNPNAFLPAECGLLLETIDGNFEIWRAQGDTPEDAFFCPEEDAVVEVEGNFGEGAVRAGG